MQIETSSPQPHPWECLHLIPEPPCILPLHEMLVFVSGGDFIQCALSVGTVGSRAAGPRSGCTVKESAVREGIAPAVCVASWKPT